MRYTLWSRGRLVGHTDLDVYTVTSTMRQGFIEPTPEGLPLLADATGVWRAIAEVKRGKRARGEPGANDHELILEAMRRREELEFELRDAHGARFELDFVRIMDNFDDRVVDDMCDTEEEMEAEFQIRLSGLSEADREKALAQRAADNAEIEAAVAEMLEDGDEMLDSGWSPSPPQDPRWDTMQYLMQVHLRGPGCEKDS